MEHKYLCVLVALAVQRMIDIEPLLKSIAIGVRRDFPGFQVGECERHMTFCLVTARCGSAVL
eukprot:8230485-Heterocapsa_arctica.AAC.1